MIATIEAVTPLHFSTGTVTTDCEGTSYSPGAASSLDKSISPTLASDRFDISRSLYYRFKVSNFEYYRKG